MRHVFLKEVNAFLNSLIAYIVLSVFLIGVGLLVWVFPETSVLDYGYADLDTFFSFGPYVLLFLLPAITMRTFAEEKKAGTLELLYTRPLTDWQIILGKYLSSLFLLLLALLPTLLYYYSLSELGNPPGNIDGAAVAGSYLGLFLLGASFAAVGVFASSLTENQIISFLVALFLCFLLYTGFSSLAALDVLGSTGYVVQQLGILYHYGALSKGLIDSRNVLYFISLILLMLMLTKLVLSSRKW
ncbi:gliding motility-associated ABC transporter permease subunit GldF [Cesiribacter andamanensis]|uniref:ABC-type transport system involved in multi-copper enzyme maturation, permease component n=1 Tax=Cesiribacter andamanensis AMV16 TaxID=1279009 RepID=M7N4F9_9BACT|nr:gliding motility-associated ABC transporter permease subunit GldF [Cesiribacter andamanensis]EMR03558.1 ABC-type transport system involved in multi-copper enzyme maturation, permease component [Cesiribacter andamanensis AMV16]